MCVNEELKLKIRQRLDSVIVAIKVAKTVEEHHNPDGGDAVVEVMMEELMKLHSCYGKEKTEGQEKRIAPGAQSATKCSWGATAPAEPRNDGDFSHMCGDTCGGPEEPEACPCPSKDACDCSRRYDLPFGCALEEAKGGARIARKGWNGKGQYVFYVKELEFHTDADLSAYEHEGVFVHDALAFMGTHGLQVGWLASQADMLSNDWYIVD